MNTTHTLDVIAPAKGTDDLELMIYEFDRSGTFDLDMVGLTKHSRSDDGFGYRRQPGLSLPVGDEAFAA